MTATPRLALIGNRSETVPAHARLEQLEPHLDAHVQWLPSQEVVSDDTLGEFDAIWVIPGSPYRSKDGVLRAIRFAREQHIPYLGTCGGFQHALMEFARNELGLTDADDVQYDPEAATPLIVPLTCCLKGQTAPLHLGESTRIASVYGRCGKVAETYHCQYGLNPDFVETIRDSALTISAWDDEKAPRAVELPSHPFFLATLFQPELSSTPSDVHPLIVALLAAARDHASAR